jgi:hypothetical protein
MWQKILDVYSSIFNTVPSEWRTVAAVVVVVILVSLFLGFIKRSFVWILIFILLMPTAYPAFKQLGISFYNYIIAPLIK